VPSVIGAVYWPEELTMPPFCSSTLQATSVSGAPVTAAEKVCIAPGARVADEGWQRCVSVFERHTTKLFFLR